MKDKYSLSRAENVFVAKKLFYEAIHCGAKLGDTNITLPETMTILNGVNVPNVTIDDIQTVLNMRDAWRYLIKSVDDTFNLKYICSLNSYVSRNESIEWGVLRKGNVGIGGTNYKPKIPVESEIAQGIDSIIQQNVSVTEKAIKVFLFIARSQMFWDGNKRTSLLSANKLLISQGKGVLVIPENILNDFHVRLTAFYESNDYSKIDSFLYENCIHGIDYEQVEEHNEDYEIEQ
jgi:prophage maintenance system killer protein